MKALMCCFDLDPTVAVIKARSKYDGAVISVDRADDRMNDAEPVH